MQKDSETPPRAERAPGARPHQPPPDAEDADERVEEGAQESFPSSDPPATGGPGI